VMQYKYVNRANQSLSEPMRTQRPISLSIILEAFKNASKIHLNQTNR